MAIPRVRHLYALNKRFVMSRTFSFTKFDAVVSKNHISAILPALFYQDRPAKACPLSEIWPLQVFEALGGIRLPVVTECRQTMTQCSFF
ncbi:MAG: hypothetical protein WCS40_02770, partial [Methanomethylophilus sp.]